MTLNLINTINALPESAYPILVFEDGSIEQRVRGQWPSDEFTVKVAARLSRKMKLSELVERYAPGKYSVIDSPGHYRSEATVYFCGSAKECIHRKIKSGGSIIRGEYHGTVTNPHLWAEYL